MITADEARKIMAEAQAKKNAEDMQQAQEFIDCVVDPAIREAIKDSKTECYVEFGGAINVSTRIMEELRGAGYTVDPSIRGIAMYIYWAK